MKRKKKKIIATKKEVSKLPTIVEKPRLCMVCKKRN